MEKSIELTSQAQLLIDQINRHLQLVEEKSR